MENQDNIKSPIEREDNIQAGTIAKSFLANVFTYMFFALAITGIVAYWFGTDASMISLILNVSPEGMSLNVFGYFVMFAPFGLVLLMSFGYQKLSSVTLVVLFIIYSVFRNSLEKREPRRDRKILLFSNILQHKYQ